MVDYPVIMARASPPPRPSPANGRGSFHSLLRRRGRVGVGATRMRESARGVFSGQLRRDVGIGAGSLLRRLLVHLQPGFASPGALQLVLDVEGEPPDAVDLQLDLVAVLKGVETAVVGAGGDDVTRLQGVDRAQPLDAARDFVR